MFSYHRNDETDRERYLASEVERLEQESRDEDDRRERQRQERERERKEQREYDLRQADTWPEALRKDMYLLGREVDPEFEASDGDYYFTDATAACKRALEIWNEHEKAHYERIEELRRLIEQEKEAVKQGVADQLEKEMPERGGKSSFGWSGIVQSLRALDDPSELLNW